MSDVIKGIEWAVNHHRKATIEAAQIDEADDIKTDVADAHFGTKGNSGKFPFPGEPKKPPKNPKEPKNPQHPKHPKKVRSVANMSLGGGRSRALDQAVDRAVEGGVLFAVAAGNDGQDACNYSPAAASNAISVGATSSIDYMASFSNHGPCVHVYAPGKDIQSTWTGSSKATNTISGKYSIVFAMNRDAYTLAVF